MQWRFAFPFWVLLTALLWLGGTQGRCELPVLARARRGAYKEDQDRVSARVLVWGLSAFGGAAVVCICGPHRRRKVARVAAAISACAMAVWESANAIRRVLVEYAATAAVGAKGLTIPSHAELASTILAAWAALACSSAQTAAVRAISTCWSTWIWLCPGTKVDPALDIGNEAFVVELGRLGVDSRRIFFE